MTRCTAQMAIDCTGEAVAYKYLDEVEKGQRLCAPCLSYAAKVGMNPKDDRRAVTRVPQWRKRNLARVLDHGRGVA